LNFRKTFFVCVSSIENFQHQQQQPTTNNKQQVQVHKIH